MKQENLSNHVLASQIIEDIKPMEALKLKGWIDSNGQLHLQEVIALPEGKVELILWQESPAAPLPNSEKKPVKTSVKAFQDLFEGLEPVADDFDTDEVKWEALKEKYDL